MTAVWPADAPSPLPPPLHEEQGRRAPIIAQWRPWTALAALIAGLVLAAIAGAIVTIPAVALGAHITGSHVPGGVLIADTVVQDVAFVLAAVLVARMAHVPLRPAQFGLRSTDLGRAVLLIVALYISFFAFTAIWQSLLNSHTSEQLLNQLGANENTALLIASAVLTCVIAPACEEFLFRGYMFTALRNWRGPWVSALITGIIFGAVHASSAPVVYLLPLAFFGFGLCLLYWRTGSLLPCIATHAINNSLAFASLEGWSAGGYVALAGGSLLALGTVAISMRARGLIAAA